MTTEKTPVDRALDFFVFGPLGFALTVREALPGLADKGRKVVETQVGMAKIMGQFAVTAGRQEAEKRAKTFRAEAESTLERIASGGATRPAPATTTTPAPAAAAATSAPPVATELEPDPAPAEAAPVARANGLAIPAYDTLAASQIVQRLAGLAHDELEAVRAYEHATRARKTILNRVAQLQGVNGAG